MIRIGIIGTGTISTALVTGFLTCEEGAGNYHFYLSPRNTAKAAALKERFPDGVTVCENNQEAVDASEWVFLTVLPRQGEEVISPLSFREDQKILTIMSDHPVERVQEWTAPASKIVRMVPLPFAALHIGPIAIYPEDSEIRQMFTPLGEIISVQEQGQLSIISGLTAIMSAYYHLIYDVTDWGCEQGLPAEASLKYMTAFFEALSHKAALAPDGDVKALAYEMTPGGLNEMALKNLLGHDAFRLWRDALDEVMARLNAHA